LAQQSHLKSNKYIVSLLYALSGVDKPVLPILPFIHTFMPTQLMKLNEQLLNLKIVHEHAVFSDMPLKDIKKISKQIKEIEMLIAERKEIINRNGNSNLFTH
jgi:hypothetical protein